MAALTKAPKSRSTYTNNKLTIHQMHLIISARNATIRVLREQLRLTTALNRQPLFDVITDVCKPRINKE